MPMWWDILSSTIKDKHSDGQWLSREIGSVMPELKQVALCVGASRGIGRQIAIDLASNGYAGDLWWMQLASTLTIPSCGSIEDRVQEWQSSAISTRSKQLRLDNSNCSSWDTRTRRRSYSNSRWRARFSQHSASRASSHQQVWQVGCSGTE